MKKIVLLTAAILAISSSITAEEVNNGFLPLLKQDSTVIGSFQSGIDITDTEGNSENTVKLILADGFITDSKWKGWELGYYVFREDSGNTAMDNLMVAEIKPKYTGKTSWGSWSSTTFLTTEYTAQGVKQEFSVDYNLKRASIGTKISAKQVNGEGDFRNKSMEAEVAYRKFIAGGMATAMVRYKPLSEITLVAETDFGNLAITADDAVELSIRTEYGKLFGMKAFGIGFLEYQSGENTARTYTEISQMRLGIMGDYKVTPQIAIMGKIEQKIALVDRDIDGSDTGNVSKASTDETALGLGLKYNF